MDLTKRDEDHNFNTILQSQDNQKKQPVQRTQASETANYIADMILELRNLAKSNQFKVLSELLEISYYEAFSCANHIAIPPGEAEFIHRLGADARKATAAAG